MLVRSRFRFRFFPGDLIPCETLADDPSHGQLEAVEVRDLFAILSLAEVVAESLFVEIAEEVKRFHANIRATDGPLEQAPIVFKPVRVNLIANVALGVVDDFVCVFRDQSAIRLQLIGVISGGSLLLILIAALMKIDVEQLMQMKVGDAGLVKVLGKSLFKNYVLPFEISSVLFLSAMVGAVVISKKDA